MTPPLDEINRAIGGLEAQVDGLISRAEEDRAARDKDHAENQLAMGELRASTQGAITEMRQQIKQAVEELTGEVRRNGNDYFGKGKLAMMAMLGLVTFWFIGHIFEAGVEWLITHFVNLNFHP
jgi:hypothetical protein